jgi:hypothetical protein
VTRRTAGAGRTARCGVRACEVNPFARVATGDSRGPALVPLIRGPRGRAHDRDTFRRALRRPTTIAARRCPQHDRQPVRPHAAGRRRRGPPAPRSLGDMIAHVIHLVLLVSLGLVPGPAPGVWPLQPRPEVVRAFDPPTVRWGSGHRGVDLLGRPGQQVHAALGGTVTFAGLLAGRGVVVVDHGDTRTTYQPVRARVHVGSTVSRGQVIGTLQSFPSHCWPRTCLHWGWIRGDTYLDPLILVGAGPVRLFPAQGGPFVSDRCSPPTAAQLAPLVGLMPTPCPLFRRSPVPDWTVGGLDPPAVRSGPVARGASPSAPGPWTGPRRAEAQARGWA